MTTYYIACDLGAESGRVIEGTLNNGKLMLSESHRFSNQPIKDKTSLYWDIPQLFQEVLIGLRKVAEREDPVAGDSWDCWGVDYVLFESDGSLLTPTYHYRDPRSQAGMKEVLAKVPWETIYAETGIQKMPINTLFQLGAEKSKRFGKAHQLLSIADGFNFLLSGAAKSEVSMASTTQLYNPITKNWSDKLIHALRLPPKLLPPIVGSGTVLGPLRSDLAQQTKLEDAQVIASCSHDTAAAVAALPAAGQNWAFLSSGTWSLMGVEVPEPIINDTSRELNFTNEIGYGDTVRLLKNIAGLWIVQECRHYWAEKEQDLDYDVLTHLAASSPPFESLINPADPRFLEPGDMPAKVQAFCKETRQPVPRKPGPIIRCILESLALLYRKTLQEIENVTGRKIERLHIVGGGTRNSLLNHFTANALQIPVVIGPAEATAAGNVLVQAMALGHVPSLEQARKIARDSFDTEIIQPHAAAWIAAFARLEKLFVKG
ncbi:MAG: rhamnulokinase [Verrucomicrobia bacterium]|nr:MAG: rhamnulokinase [Verrucomicrobiota bacterium]